MEGVERPTTNSDGKPIHATIDGVKNFWKWFGDSKVVDKDGKPLVVYHGTKKEFTEFGREKKPFSNAHRAWYFTPKKEYASVFGSKYGGEDIAVYLKIANPETGLSNDFIEDFGYYASEKDLDNLNDKGIDGLFQDDLEQIVVLKSPNQIKSVNNEGTWSEDTNDIRFSRTFDSREELEESKEFRDWSKRSVLVNKEEAKDYNFKERVPVTVVGSHGTEAVFNVFDISKLGKNGRMEGSGFYFTNSDAIAGGYSKGTGRVINAYIHFNKPLLYDSEFLDGELETYLEKVAELDRQEKLKDPDEDADYTIIDDYGGLYEAIDLLQDDSIADVMGDLINVGLDAKIANDALTQSLGYDGFITKGFSNEAGDDMIYVPLHSNQIKDYSLETNDDLGNLIEQSERFSESDDIRYSISEEQSIKDEAKANGTFMQAPNGEPTNLNEKQWLQVRTKAFKNWFGDWEKAARIEKLRNSKAVEINEKDYKGKYELNRDSAKQYMKDNLRGTYVNKDTGDKVDLVLRGANKLTSHDERNNAHLKSIAAIPEMISDAIFIEERNKEKENDKFDSYRYYVVGLKIDNEDYTARITIGVKRGKFYYDHQLTQIKKGALIDSVNRRTKSDGNNDSTLSDHKDTKLLSILQNNASKVVDENGEPMVVYHGTKGDFNIFDSNKRSNYNAEKGVFFFTKNPEIAGQYALVAKNNTVVELEKKYNEAFEMQKKSELLYPKPEWGELNAKATGMIDDIREAVKKNTTPEKQKESASVYPVFLNIKNPYTEDREGTMWRDATDKIKKGGDGAIFYNTDDPANIYLTGNPTDVFVATSPNQIKSATANVGTFDNGNDIRYSMQDKNLAPLNNITEGDLMSALNGNGLIAPSIAMTNVNNEYSDFGDIALIAPKNMVDVTKDNVRLFSGDVYSPTIPRPSYHVNTKELDKFSLDI